jgi:hypothetical protein
MLILTFQWCNLIGVLLERWLRKTSYLKSFAIPASAERGETDAFAGQMQK